MRQSIVLGCMIGLFLVIAVSAHCQQQPPHQATFIPQTYTQHAEPKDISGPSGVVTAQGERPLYEFPEKHEWVPLGTVAREYKEGKPVKREKQVVIP